MVKNPPANAGEIRDTGSIPGLGSSPAGGHGNPLQYSYIENPHGQRSLAGYSPQGHKESDMTEHAHTHKGRKIIWSPTYSFSSVQSLSHVQLFETP